MTSQFPPAAGGPAPGWYADPNAPGLLRYWDGLAWTQHTSPVPLGAYVTAPPLRHTELSPESQPDPLDQVGGQPYVGPIKALKLGFKQYVKFTGRSSRSEYWWWYLLTQFVVLALMIPILISSISHLRFILDHCLTTDTSVSLPPECRQVNLGSLPLTLLVDLLSLAILLPSLGLLVRRLHDTGRSGWWILISLVPIVGAILLIVWLALRGHETANQYGLPPRKGDPKPSAADLLSA